MKNEIYIYPEKLTYLRLYSDGKNVSGDNPKHLVRDEIDRYLSFDLIYEFNLNDLIEIFPEIKKFIIDDEIVKDFAISNILLSLNRPSFKAIAIKKIYGLLQNKETSKKLKAIYNFDQIDFINNISTINVFNTISSDSFLNPSLQDKSNSKIIKADKNPKCFISHDKFEITFDLGKSNSLEYIFTPDTGKYRCYEKIEVFCDGEKVKIRPLKKYLRNKSQISFFTLTPQLKIILNHPGQNLRITGKTYIINYNIVQDYFNSNFIIKLLRIIKHNIIRK